MTTEMSSPGVRGRARNAAQRAPTARPYTSPGRIRVYGIKTSRALKARAIPKASLVEFNTKEWETLKVAIYPSLQSHQVSRGCGIASIWVAPTALQNLLKLFSTVVRRTGGPQQGLTNGEAGTERVVDGGLGQRAPQIDILRPGVGAAGQQ